MKKILVVMAFLASMDAVAGGYYGTGLCAYPQYECLKIAGGQSWTNLFPDPIQRDIVQRVNRSYNSLWSGKVIAVPRNMNNKTMLDFAPFPLQINPDGEQQVIVDQDKLAWGAYDINGRLIKWGPISSGRDKCSDSNNSCRTMTGIFHFFSKENEKCRSNVFPIGKGGAKMPYCMYFHKGFAMHGSEDMPGVRASHGCIRMFTQDALWLNHEFVISANPKIMYLGTKVTVRPINSPTSGKE